MKCPICEGDMERNKVPYTVGSVELGTFEADVCSSCGEIFFTEKSSDAIDNKARELGLWGLEKKRENRIFWRLSYRENPEKSGRIHEAEKGRGDSNQA
jgi:YgiT-type zinc finger domain-containing protein